MEKLSQNWYNVRIKLLIERGYSWINHLSKLKKKLSIFFKLALKNLNIITEKFLKEIENLSGTVISIFTKM